MGADLQEALEAVKKLLCFMGLDTDEPGLRETPSRVLRFYQEFRDGAKVDLEALLKEFDYEDVEGRSFNQMVVQTDIPVEGLCEHHLLPFFGKLSIGYIPNDKVCGLSKLVRLVRAAGRRRPTIQERLTDEIANALSAALRPKGVIVVMHAIHTCMAVRGVRAPNTVTTTSAIRGVFRDVPSAREEFFQLVRTGYAGRWS